MLYLESDTRPYISFAVNQCSQFTYNTRALHKIDVKRICRYLQGKKDKGVVFNPYKKLVVNFYADAYFTGLCVHESTQDRIPTSSRNGFVVTFPNCPLLWVSKL